MKTGPNVKKRDKTKKAGTAEPHVSLITALGRVLKRYIQLERSWCRAAFQLALRSVGRLRHGCNVRIFGSFRDNRKFEEKQPASLLIIIDVSCRVTALVSPSTALQADYNSN
ncbi:hypothetical protein J6590_096397 [Homalodisca vitripennis]|nr:hypothetical protein J6590_096397 [Homalodisca vitripennis]